MKKTIPLSIVLLMLIISSFSIFADGDVTISGSFSKDGNEKPPQTLPFSFTPEETLSSKWACTVASSPSLYGNPIVNVASGGKADKATAGNCKVGQFVEYIECTSATGCTAQEKLFQHFWFKSSSTDMIDYSKYWTSTKGAFKASYICYDCKLKTGVSTYTCYDGIYRGEPLTPYEGIQGQCSTGCKVKVSTTQTTDKNIIAKEMCTSLVSSPPPGSNNPPQGDNTGGAGSTGSGSTPSGSVPSVALNGKWTSISSPSKVLPDTTYVVKASFQAEADGKYYLEAGSPETPLTVTATASKCDGSVNWAGEFVDLKAGESVEMNFNIKSYNKVGKYEVVIGAYTGCLSSDKHPEYTGQSITKKSETVLVVNEGDIIPSGVRELFTSSNIIIMAVLISAVAFIFMKRK